MKTRLTMVVAILWIAGMLGTSLVLGQTKKPSVASPITDTPMAMVKHAVNTVVPPRMSTTTRMSITTVSGSMVAGGDRLVAKQNADGGWGWPLIGTSAQNTIGPIAMGLAQAYQQTGSATERTALVKASAFLLAKSGNFSPSDGYLAAELDKVLGVSTHTLHVKTNFYDKLEAGTYQRLGVSPSDPTFYTTASYITLIRTRRSGSQANMAAWDIGMGLVGAASCGAITTEWIAGVKAEINELDGVIVMDNVDPPHVLKGTYDVIGLAGAVYGLAFVNEDFNPTAGQHEAASNINDLANTLASYQIAGKGFAWNQAYVIPADFNEVIQETGYAILALNEVNRATYLSNIQGAANYMMSVQLVTGGWRNDEYVDPIYGNSSENNEVTGEAIWGISTAFPAPVHNITKDVYYPTIQSGISDASTGNTITVAAGTYAENVVINKSVSLLASPGAILNGTGLSGAGFEVKAADITVNGFEIKNYLIGIRTFGGYGEYGDLQILNCSIHNNTQNGILFVYDNFDRVLLDQNQISGNAENGIGISNSAIIANLVIQNSSSSTNGQHGMFIANATLNNVLIENSSFDGATTPRFCGITFGTTKSTVGSFTVNGGSLSGNAGGGLYVAQFPSTFAAMVLNGVTIQNNLESGVLLGGGGSAVSLTVSIALSRETNGKSST